MVDMEKKDTSQETIVGRNTFGLIMYWGTALLCWVGILFFRAQIIQRSSGAWIACVGGAIGIPIMMLFFRRHYYYSYGVSDRGLTEYFFGKKQREISWDEVKQVGVQHDLFMGGQAPCLIVTLEPVKPFSKENPTGSAKYYKTFWPRVLMIHANQHSKQVIEWFYGPLDY